MRALRKLVCRAIGHKFCCEMKCVPCERCGAVDGMAAIRKKMERDLARMMSMSGVNAVIRGSGAAVGKEWN